MRLPCIPIFPTRGGVILHRPAMETHEKVKVNQKRQKTLEHRVIVEQVLGEVELIL